MKRGTSGLNLLLAIDKPCGCTSHDVVARVRRALGEGRVGHAGTLDPDASGLMIVGVGQGTRLMGLLTLDRKSYEARITFGTETDTCDAAGSVVASAPVPAQLADERQAAAYLATLVGDHDQIPPRFSAISVDGVRAYDRARSGEDFELPSRHITILESQLLGVDATDGVSWNCRFLVSKGCYIRSIARDIGQALGCPAHLSALRRTSSGTIDLSGAHTTEQIAELGPAGVRSVALNPLEALGLRVRELNSEEAESVSCGRRIPRGTCTDGREPAPDERVALVEGGLLRGIWRTEGPRLVCDVNFSQGIEGIN